MEECVISERKTQKVINKHISADILLFSQLKHVYWSVFCPMFGFVCSMNMYVCLYTYVCLCIFWKLFENDKVQKKLIACQVEVQVYFSLYSLIHTPNCLTSSYDDRQNVKKNYTRLKMIGLKMLTS